MNVRARIRAHARSAIRKAVVPIAQRSGLEVYEPNREHLFRLETQAEYREDSRPVRDKRGDMGGSGDRGHTVTTEALEDMLDVRGLQGSRVLEVGPKHGFHSLWLDRALAPAELVLLDFPSEHQVHDEWRNELHCPHHFVYRELSAAAELLELDRFDLVFFLGVLYHSVYHVQMLAMLNRVTRIGGLLLLETTVDPRRDASVRLRWKYRSGKAKAVPTLEAVRLMLAWTGWRDVVRFSDYRPGSTEVVLLCEKTDELADGTDFAATVAPHRPAVTPVA
jgi:predicted O-methyltransferase YrrM